MGTPPAELVSIITPAYNAQAYIEQTIASVRAQTCARWEWIIVDDASTDRTAELVQAAAASDQRIHLVRQPRNTGLAACGRNAAMARATGEFFAFLDADDLWEPDKLQLQLDYLRQRPDVAGVAGWIDQFGYAKRVDNTHSIMPTRTVIGPRDFLRGLPIWGPTLLMRRRCYDEAGPMNEDPRLVCGEDHEYFARLTQRYTFHRICRVVTHVRVHPPGKSVRAAYLRGAVIKTLNVLEVLQEQGMVSPSEARIMRSQAYYSQAADNLFFHGGPVRPLLLKSVLAGRPPLRAAVMLALCFLPNPLLRPVLRSLQALARRWRL